MANNIDQIIITRNNGGGWYIITAKGSEFFEDWDGVLNALQKMGV